MTVHTTQSRLTKSSVRHHPYLARRGRNQPPTAAGRHASTHHDPVAGAHRDGLERILAEIHAAQERLDDGRFGICQGCGAAIPVERLELRPWTPLCVPCAAGKAA